MESNVHLYLIFKSHGIIFKNMKYLNWEMLLFYTSICKIVLIELCICIFDISEFAITTTAFWII
jgi:hypothetical protein